MTVASEIVTRTYIGNGLVREWPLPFELPLNGEQYVQIYITAPGGAPELLASGYSVDITAKTVRYPISGDPLASGYKITIRRQLPYTQETDLNSQGPFDPETIEKTFDRNVMQIQQIADDVRRAAKVPIGSTENSDDLWNDLKIQVGTATSAASAAAQSEANAASLAEAAGNSAVRADASADRAADILIDVEGAGDNALNAIENAKTNAVNTVNTAGNTATNKVHVAGDTVINNVNTSGGSLLAAAENHATAAAASAEEAAASAKLASQYSKGLEFEWDDTSLGVRREGEPAFEFTDLQGPPGTIDVSGITINTTAPLLGGGSLANNLTLSIGTATESAFGTTRYATAAEAAAGTLTTRAINPLRLKGQLDLKADKSAVVTLEETLLGKICVLDAPVERVQELGTITIDSASFSYNLIVDAGNIIIFTLTTSMYVMESPVVNINLIVSGAVEAGTCRVITLFFTHRYADYSIVWPTAIKWAGGIAPPIAYTSASVTEIITLISPNNYASWYGVHSGSF